MYVTFRTAPPAAALLFAKVYALGKSSYCPPPPPHRSIFRHNGTEKPPGELLLSKVERQGADSSGFSSDFLAY